jgi:uncharacterized damage-inducible protein DinB
MADLHPRIHTALVSVNPTSENPAWHGAPTALGVLRGVRAAAAVWRPYPGANNLREIALHIAFWENSVANRLSGENMLVGFKQRKTGWAVMLDAVDESQWKAEIGLVKAAHQRLVQAVTGFDPELLDHPAGKRTTRKAIELIHGVAEHTLYHTAQMEMLKTLAAQARIGSGANESP